VAPIEPTLKAAVAKEKLNAHMALKKRKTLQIPHYKKIEQQKRLFSTKKKTKKTNNYSTVDIIEDDTANDHSTDDDDHDNPKRK
jgi:hypothetical protein